MKTQLRNLFLLLACAGFMAGCGTLAPEGVYQGDKALYDADLTIATAYDVLHTFVSWEKNNRALLTDFPAVTDYANTVRGGAKRWISSAIAVRDAYAANPTPEGRTALDKALAVLREAVRQASVYMVSSTQ